VKLTVIGEKLAKPGLTFVYAGETDPGCAPCKLRKVCHGELLVNREYRVKSARPVKHAVCHVYEGDVQVVEVEPAPLPLRIAIPLTATRGTGVTKRWEECGASCLHKRACNSAALAEGQTAGILKVEGDVPCLVGRKLKFALVEPQ
jgi:uncharacterized protein